MSRKVLSLSADLVLLVNRNHALTNAGFSVSSPRTIEDAPKLLGSDRFSAVLIGDSIKPQVRQGLIDTMREVDPAVPIIFVTVIPGRSEPKADANVDVSQDFAELLRTLNRYTGDGSGPR